MAKKKIAERLLNEYRLTIRNEDDFAERGVYVVTLVRVMIAVLIVFILFSVSTFFIGRYITTEYYTSNYQAKKVELDELTYELSEKTDNLEKELKLKQQFIESYKYYLGGVDSTIPEVEIPDYEISPKAQVANLHHPVRAHASSKILSDVYFLPPMAGYGVSRGFNVNAGHFGVDVVAKEDEPILSVADGTVIFSSWTNDAGYVVGLQHEGNITSLYKHNSVVLKKPGDLVKAGDVIAIIGNTGKLTSGPHLHFEMWNNGEPLNPEHYILFEK